MRHIKLAGLLTVALVLGACGTSSSSNNNAINGNWTATLLDANGKAVFGFTTVLTSIGTGEVTVTNFKFTSSSPCFGTGSTETGGFTLGGNFNGMVMGSFTLTVQSGTTGSNGSNLLTLQGTVNNNNTVSGTWTLTGTGAGCTGSGNFTMNRS